MGGNRSSKASKVSSKAKKESRKAFKAAAKRPPGARAIAAKSAPKGANKETKAKGPVQAKGAAKPAARPPSSASGGAISSLKKMLGIGAPGKPGAAPVSGPAAQGKGRGAKGAAPVATGKGAKPGPAGAGGKGPQAPAAERARRGRGAGKGALASDLPKTALATSLRPAKPEAEALPPGAPVCREVACELMATTGGYCRMHYIKNWKKIKRKELILKEKKLNHYIEELVSKYPDKYIEAIRQDLASEKDFAKVIADLEIDEGLDDFESVETEGAEGIIDNIKREFDDDGDVF